MTHQPFSVLCFLIAYWVTVKSEPEAITAMSPSIKVENLEPGEFFSGMFPTRALSFRVRQTVSLLTLRLDTKNESLAGYQAHAGSKAPEESAVVPTREFLVPHHGTAV